MSKHRDHNLTNPIPATMIIQREHANIQDYRTRPSQRRERTLEHFHDMIDRLAMEAGILV